MIEWRGLRLHPRTDGTYAVYKNGACIGHIAPQSEREFTFLESGYDKVYTKDREAIAEFVASLAVARIDERQKKLREDTSRWNG